MTAAVESLHRQYPGQYRVSVDTSYPEIWENNPHVEPWDGTGRVVELEYPAIHESHLLRTGHFMGAFVADLGNKLGIPLRLQVNRPALYLTDAERAEHLVEENYFVVNAGTKPDFTTKAWNGYQEVVDHFRGRVKFVQIGEAHHNHRPLEGTLNLIGKTTLRQLFSLVHNSLGGIGPTTLLQHVHAALGRYYVCLLGGREPLNWCWYPGQTVFSTQGQLTCCRESACWRSRVVALGDGDDKDKSLCALPVVSGPTPVAACMDAITPDMVIRAVETYLQHGRN